MGKAFDVIVVGARCAGSPTAMLLARKGYRVLAVDRASFPSDTVSTHLVHPRCRECAIAMGLRDRLVATGCPPIHTYAFDFGAFHIAGAPGTDRIPLPTARGGPSSTNCWSTPPSSPARRSVRALPSRK
jgi:2-polyprenyl-6-methoxyphenol hydroxylase-like FAD-dependent oxidoreductase